MPDGPIQVVLQPEAFRQNRERPNGGGAGKDFYRNNDAEFGLHRDEISNVVRALLARHAASSRLNLAVQMRPDALAKSHRPFRALFTRSRASHIGSGSYGELIFAVTPAKLRRILELISGAETQVQWRPDASGQLRYAPTLARAEVSAIASLREWLPAEARGFTLDEAEVWLEANPSARAEVELFDIPQRGPLRHDAISGLANLVSDRRVFRELFELSPPSIRGLRSERVPALNGPGEVRAVTSRSIDSAAFRRELARIEASSLVKRVGLEDAPGDDPDGEERPHAMVTSLPSRSGDGRPVVGVIDGGVEWEDPACLEWVVGRTGYIAPEHRSIRRQIHGTAIASLVAKGADLNPSLLSADEDCRVYDLDIIPAREYWPDYYPTPLLDFVDVLRESVQRAREETGARVFNLSYNFLRAPGTNSFSPVARALDEIAIELDVIFVISAGNLSAEELREEWPSAEADVLAMIARTRTADGLGAPAESIANVSVGATNPPGMAFGIQGVPTRYTRRSAAVPSAIKPDFSAPGGGVRVNQGDTSGLLALNPYGNEIEVEGTSYAAPLVARYLATLDASIAGDVPREVLLALATHHAQLDAEMVRSQKVAKLATSFLGRGSLPSVRETLDGDAHRMTIVLSDVIEPGKRVIFGFQWPGSLTTSDGKSRGRVRLTLVSQPTLNHVHGDEAVRVNLDGALKQLDPRSGLFGSQVRPTHEFFSGYSYANERTLATELGKWFPIKSFERTMRGVGRSADWQLEIGYLTRAAEELPPVGIRFGAVLTIEDPAGAAPVYDEMRASLTTVGVSLNDLRNWTTVGVRT